MKISVPRGQGPYITNALRQMIYTRRPVVRPIAFSTGNSNVLSAGNLVIEDMLNFSSALTKLNYCCGQINNRVGEIFSKTYSFKGVLHEQDLNSGDLKVLSNTNDEILHSAPDETGFPATITVTIYFRIACGCFNSEDNLSYLLNYLGDGSNVDVSRYIMLSSRHCDVDVFTHTIETFPDHDDVELSVDVFSGESEKEILMQAKQALVDCLAKI